MKIPKRDRLRACAAVGTGGKTRSVNGTPNPTNLCSGTLRLWNDEKGFGFIKPRNSGADVFVHISAFEDRNSRPCVGALIAYHLGRDEYGRPRAVSARLSSSATGTGPTFAPIIDRPPPMQRPIQPSRPKHARPRRLNKTRRATLKLEATLGAMSFIGALTVAAYFHAIPAWVPAAYFTVSFITFFVYSWDKDSAEAGDRRVAENTLHFLELLGGWPGALVAQYCIRHKTAKLGFQIIFWLVALAHLGFWVWLALGRPGW
jgi:uncharacterized membrane protein YsdA (DUF1294 family)/cold shock CspA family protein